MKVDKKASRSRSSKEKNSRVTEITAISEFLAATFPDLMEKVSAILEKPLPEIKISESLASEILLLTKKPHSLKNIDELIDDFSTLSAEMQEIYLNNLERKAKTEVIDDAADNELLARLRIVSKTSAHAEPKVSVDKHDELTDVSEHFNAKKIFVNPAHVKLASFSSAAIATTDNDASIFVAEPKHSRGSAIN